MADHILVPTSPGELFDKLSILRLKVERIDDKAKVANVKVEQAVLLQTATNHVPPSAELDALCEKLYQINSDLWVVEDDIRDCERAKDFGDEFIRLARAVYVTNDQRSHVKKEINLLLGSELVEEKSYADHGVTS